MANKFKGEATAVVDGATYTLRCDFNAMCAFEAATGQDAMAAFSGFEAGKVSTLTMRAMMLAFLGKHHADADKEIAGEILSEDLDALTRVMTAAMPDAAEVGDTGNAPTKATKAA